MGEARQRKTRITLASHMREKIIEGLTDQVLTENPADVTTVNRSNTTPANVLTSRIRENKLSSLCSSQRMRRS